MLPPSARGVYAAEAGIRKGAWEWLVTSLPCGRLCGVNAALRERMPSVSLSSIANGGEGRGEEALGNGETSRTGEAPLSPTLSPLGPRGVRETDRSLTEVAGDSTFGSQSWLERDPAVLKPLALIHARVRDVEDHEGRPQQRKTQDA